MPKKPKAASLAQFVSATRENVGLSQSGLAQRCNLTISEIENIENGSELFLSSTVRQKLAKGLKTDLSEIKQYEKSEKFEFTPDSVIENIKDEILLGTKEILCPNCNSPLITRIARLYDLEDNLVLHPKAYCPKCPVNIS